MPVVYIVLGNFPIQDRSGQEVAVKAISLRAVGGTRENAIEAAWGPPDNMGGDLFLPKFELSLNSAISEAMRVELELYSFFVFLKLVDVW